MTYQHLTSFILRLSFGGLMLSHGWGKFNKLVSGDFRFPDPVGLGAGISLGLAVIGEFICPILLIVGFRTKWASIPPAITMLVAAFIIHADDPWSKKEFPLLYFFGYLALFLLGSGKYSLDWRLKKI